MPREKQKRGRRAQEKEKENEAKRKWEDNVEEQASKRQKPSTTVETGDYIPLDVSNEEISSVHATESPFYGLLDSEEQEYFSRANELLELNQFQDAEERSIFIESVYKEAKGKELKIACSQSCSRLLEKLIVLSDTHQIRRLFNKFIGHFLNLVQHRFASHCCETLFIHAAPAVTNKIPKPNKRQSNEGEEEDDDAEPEMSLADMFLQVITELEGNWGYLLTERFASHTIRVLLLVLAGEPIDVSSNNSVVASRKKEKLGVPAAERKAETAILQKKSVPEAFIIALKKIMNDMTAGLDDTYLRALATHPVGNPVLQVLLSLELSHFGKSSAKDPKSITRRLVPDESLEEGSQSAVFLSGLLYDPVGSRLLETFVRSAPGKLFKNFHRNIIRERIASLSRNEIAAYVVVRVLERIGKDDLQTDRDLISPEIPGLVERSRLIVPRTLIERCIARDVDTVPLAKAFEASYDKDPATRLRQLLKLEKSVAQDDQAPGPAKSENQRGAAPEQVHGSLLAQAMLRVSGPLSELVYSSLLATSSEDILSIAQNSITSHVLQQALTLPTSAAQFRRQFVPRFLSHIKDLALDSSGSHVVDALWSATKDIFFLKERIAQELAENEHTLRDSFVGRMVWKNWSMDLYKRGRGEWKQKAKGIESGAEGDTNEEKKPVKSKIDLARARFVENAEKSKRMRSGPAPVAARS
jgi:nucleolar protein 9